MRARVLILYVMLGALGALASPEHTTDTVTVSEPVFFSHYVVIDGDTLDISALYEYKMREYMEHQGMHPSLMHQLSQPVEWPRTLTTLGLSIGLKLGIDHTLKHTVNELRPDGSDRHSFPSRHATWAYGIGAKMSYVLAPYSPWCAVGLHTIANGIGMQRVMKRRHYPHDVLAGAGIGIGTDLLSRVVGNWIFGNERLFPMWRSCVNANASCLSMTTGATLPLQRTYGDCHLGTMLRASMVSSLPITRHWAFVTDLTLESGFIKDANDYNHVLNALSAKVGIQAHFDNGPFGISTAVEAGYRSNFKVKDVEVKGGSIIGEFRVEPTVMVTERLSLGLFGACSVSRFGIDGHNRTLTAPSVGFLSTAYF